MYMYPPPPPCQEREQCLRTAREQGKELAVLQESLSQHKVELRAATTKNSQLRSSLDEITLQLKRRVRHRGGNHTTCGASALTHSQALRSSNYPLVVISLDP